MKFKNIFDSINLNLNKRKLRIFLFVIFLSGGSIFFERQIKIFIQDKSVAFYNKVDDWRKRSIPQQKNVVIMEERLLIDNDFVAFTDKLVYEFGEIISLKVITKGEISINLGKVNQKGNYEEIIPDSFYSFSSSPYPLYSSFNGIISPSEEVKIDSKKLGEGWFSINLKNSSGEYIHIPIFIDPPKINARILFIESSDTLLSYNPAANLYGVPNNYNKNLDRSITTLVPQNIPIIYKQISFDEITKVKDSWDSISCGDALLNADMVHKRNLVNLGISFQSVSDKFIDDSGALENIDVVIFGSHNEYWSEDKAINIMKFIDEGGRVLFLGGNTAYRKIYRESGRQWRHGEGLYGDKTFNKLINNYLGTYFTTPDFATYASSKVIDAESIRKYFSINLKSGQIIGSGTKFPNCGESILGISGHETDKLTPDSNGFLHLAKGQNKNGGADIVFKKFKSGGKVLNFSSLSLWHNNDNNVNLMIERFIKSVN